MVSSFYTVVNNFTECPCLRTRTSYLQRTGTLLTARFLAFVAVDIWEPLPKPEAGSQLIAVMTGTYAELRSKIPIAKILSIWVFNIFLTD